MAALKTILIVTIATLAVSISYLSVDAQSNDSGFKRLDNSIVPLPKGAQVIAQLNENVLERTTNCLYGRTIAHFSNSCPPPLGSIHEAATWDASRSITKLVTQPTAKLVSEWNTAVASTAVRLFCNCLSVAT